MRELTFNELQDVSGGVDWANVVAGAVGVVTGAAAVVEGMGIVGTALTAPVAILGAVGGGMVIAGGLIVGVAGYYLIFSQFC